MKLLLAIGTILLAGILLIVLALVRQEPELEATRLPDVQDTPGAQPLPVPSEHQAILEVVVEDTPEPMASTPEPGLTEPPATTPAQEACARLIQIRKEELEEAQDDFADVEEEYEQAWDSVDDAVGSGVSQDVIDQLKQELEEAEDEKNAAEQDVKNAERHFRQAQMECGLL